ncbi:hypothetical protein BH10ACI2_BH10ACI2_09170 [soil metagenome]
MFFKLITVLLPWAVKKQILIGWFRYEIEPDCRIGLSWIFPKKLVMKKGSRIGSLSVAVHLDLITIGEDSTIDRGNWITGFPSGTGSPHFAHQPDRISELILGNSSAITKNHHIDCTNRIEIGSFSTIAGYRSQLLTHSIDVVENRQDSAPIYIGDYTFVGTNCVILGGSSLPSHSVLGAKSLLNKVFDEEWKLYAGVPAKPIRDILEDAKYFSREKGFVY